VTVATCFFTSKSVYSGKYRLFYLLIYIYRRLPAMPELKGTKAGKWMHLETLFRNC